MNREPRAAVRGSGGAVGIVRDSALFDGLSEFHRKCWRCCASREDRSITIVQTMMAVSFPAHFLLAAAMNPCPCGYLNSPVRECTCTPSMVERYRMRIAGPLLDRIDIHIEVPAVRYKDLASPDEGESSSTIRDRVCAARQIQRQRFAGETIFSNAQMTTRRLRQHCKIDAASDKFLETAINHIGLRARAYDKILKVARTIADLEGKEKIAAHHISDLLFSRSPFGLFK